MTNITRRRALAAIPAVAAITTLPALAGASDPDADLLSTINELDALIAEFHGAREKKHEAYQKIEAPIGDRRAWKVAAEKVGYLQLADASHRCNSACIPVSRRVFAMQAQTVPGVREKYRLLSNIIIDDDADIDCWQREEGEWAASIARDLDRMAGTAPTLPAAASAPDPDAGLFALFAQLESAATEFHETGEAKLDALWAAYDECPPPPELVYGETHTGKPMAVRSVEDLEEKGRLRATPERRKAVRAYEARLKPVLEKHGAPALGRRCDELMPIMKALRTKIAATPARTHRGILAKFEYALGEDDYQKALAGKGEEFEPHDATLGSAIRDVARIGGAS